MYVKLVISKRMSPVGEARHGGASGLTLPWSSWGLLPRRFLEGVEKMNVRRVVAGASVALLASLYPVWPSLDLRWPIPGMVPSTSTLSITTASLITCSTGF